MTFRLRDLVRSETFRRCAAALAATYLRVVWWTNRFSYEPANFYAPIEPHMPVILSFWHGQHFMTPFARKHYPAKVLVSKHGDGDINARAAERLGVGTVRGSGDHGNEFRRKGGVGAFKEMLRTLAAGFNMALTADVPKRARVAGLGIIMLARESGRPIMPFALATTRFIRLSNWDETTIHLPFGRGVMVMGDPIYIDRESDETAMEVQRQKLVAAMNDVTSRAYALIGRPESALLAADV